MADMCGGYLLLAAGDSTDQSDVSWQNVSCFLPSFRPAAYSARLYEWLLIPGRDKVLRRTKRWWLRGGRRVMLLMLLSARDRDINTWWSSKCLVISWSVLGIGGVLFFFFFFFATMVCEMYTSSGRHVYNGFWP